MNSAKILLPLLILTSASFTGSAFSSEEQGEAIFTQGPATKTIAQLYECQGAQARVTAMGEITDKMGNTWTVPADNAFQTAPHAFDLYNDCTGVKPDSLADVDLTQVPVVEIDSTGDVITAYLFADNYFEMYVNGQLIAVDSVPFTPFNSSVVKFKVNKPYTVVVKLIDWEENLGLGSEANRGSRYHPGDGGFIASFSDGTVTNADWSVQTFYTAPINDISCLKETDGLRDSSSCSTNDMKDGRDNYAAHWKVPENWVETDFDASSWPKATTYTEREIGVNNKNGYMNFIGQFSGAGAEFIWSSNLILDNLVLMQYTVK